jgi:hypothetical protein
VLKVFSAAFATVMPDIRGIFKKFSHFYMFEEYGKSGRGVVTSRQGKHVDLSVSVRLATKWRKWQQNWRIAPRRSGDL